MSIKPLIIKTQYLFLITILWLCSYAWADDLNIKKPPNVTVEIPELVDHIFISFTHPAVQHYAPLSEADIISGGNHRFFIRNKTIIKEVVSILKDMPGKNEKINYASRSFYIHIKGNFRDHAEIIIDQKGNYQFLHSDVKGTLSKDKFQALVAICERASNVIDIKSLEDRLRSPAGMLPCNKEEMTEMEEISRSYCKPNMFYNQ